MRSSHPHRVSYPIRNSRALPMSETTSQFPGSDAGGSHLAPETAAAPVPRPSVSGYAVWTVCSLLVLAVAIVFLQTAAFNFVNLDDDQYVYNSPETRLGLSLKGIAQAFTHSQVGNWHPLTTLSFMLDWTLFRANAGGYHLHNALLHAAAVVLLFLALRRMTGALWLSAAAAALFAIHPLRAESVAWVSERKDVLSGVYFASALLAYGFYVARPSAARYWLLFLFTAMGLMSKAILVTLPVVLLLLDYWPLKRFQSLSAIGRPGSSLSWKRFLACDGRLILEKAPLFLLAAVFALITAHLSLSASRVAAILPLHVRLAMAPVSYVTYLGQLFWPFGLAANYPFLEDGPSAGLVLAACVALLIISAAAVAFHRKYPYLLAGWLWYLVTLLPVIGIVPGGNQLMADRYTYITQIGLDVALIWLAADIFGATPSRRWPRIAASTAVIVGLMAIACRQTSYWRDNIMLWRHALSCTEGNDIAHEHLADALMDDSVAAASKMDYQQAWADMQEARQHFEEALRIMPTNIEALINLGTLLVDHGSVDDGILLYERAVQIKPDLAAGWYDLGNALRAKGNGDAAIEDYRKAVQLDPGYTGAQNNLANLLGAKGMTEEAIAHFRAAIASDPRFVQAYINLGNLLVTGQRNQEAISSYWEALQIDPKNAGAHAALGTALSHDGRIDEAMIEYRQALEIDSSAPVTWYNLGYCNEQKGNPRDALACYEHALSLVPSQGVPGLADTIRASLERCRKSLKTTTSP